jgi:hypothetical protein
MCDTAKPKLNVLFFFFFFFLLISIPPPLTRSTCAALVHQSPDICIRQLLQCGARLAASGKVYAD